MKRSVICLGLLGVSLVLGTWWSANAAEPAARGPIRVLLVTGGHDFETNQFFQMFKDNTNVSFQAVTQPQAQDWWQADKASQYDVMVFYDMWPEISEAAKSNLVARLQEGKGLVALHHCLGSYQKWDAYREIIGGKYHLEKWSKDGVEQPGSTYKHDVRFKVHVADTQHAITRGVEDFEIHDETYGGFEVLPGVRTLLTTEEPTSGRVIGWAKTYRPSQLPREGRGARVVYLQLGHDHLAYENPNYRRLVSQAIRWAGRVRSGARAGGAGRAAGSGE